MFKLYPCIALCVCALAVSAQNQTVIVKAPPPVVPETQPYGKVSIADLELKSCDFEKNANAEVLFDKGDLSNGKFERHVRIKIFTTFGKNEANIRLESGTSTADLEAETINLNDGKIEITPVERKQIYTDKVDRLRTALVFAFPNVRPGSIIEYKYRGFLNGAWNFQSNIPTRYSEIKTDFPGGQVFRFIPHVKQPFVKNVGKADDFEQLKALANIPSLPDEPYMGSRQSNLERIEYFGIIPTYNSWPLIGDLLVRFFNWDEMIDGNIKGEKEIIKLAKELKSNDEKISFIYNQVKNNVKWNDIISIFPSESSSRIWDKKIGTSADINWLTYHLLKKAGVKAYPMIVSIKQRSKLNPANPSLFSLDNVVVYIPIDTAKNYVLDATNKYNLFNNIPTDELNTYGLNIDEENKIYEPVFLENTEPVMQSVFLNAEIKADGKMNGIAEVNSYNYNKSKILSRYKTDGEEKYLKYLRTDDNNIKISGFKLDNMETDTLPLTQKFDFGIDLTGSDENYIYFKTNLFTQMGDNPFKSEERFSDIDFGYRNNYAINGMFKLPDGYKTDALPKSVTIVMPDTSITFKRIVAEDSGTVMVKYVLNHKNTLYFKEDYQDVRGFYKKMFELLNEQIVLKKI